ncbi:MAG: hypothetical protein OSJ45_03745 [Lachnospiraceae bacterium]|nr:hypothetical protein [Lachnospiraceae bacterium]
MKKNIKLRSMLLILTCIIICTPALSQAKKVSNPFADSTQERPLLTSNGTPTGSKYLRILISELSCDDKSLKQLYKYYINNMATFDYVVIDFGTDNGLFCNKKNKTFIYGTLKKIPKLTAIKYQRKKVLSK